MIEEVPARAEGEHAERKRGERMDSERSVESTPRLRDFASARLPKAASKRAEAIGFYTIARRRVK